MRAPCGRPSIAEEKSIPFTVSIAAAYIFRIEPITPEGWWVDGFMKLEPALFPAIKDIARLKGKFGHDSKTVERHNLKTA